MNAAKRLLILMFLVQGSLLHASRNEVVSGSEPAAPVDAATVVAGKCVLTPSGVYKLATPYDPANPQPMPVVHNPFVRKDCDLSRVKTELVRTAYSASPGFNGGSGLNQCLLECATTYHDKEDRLDCEAGCHMLYIPSSF